MRKRISLCLVLVLIFSLYACSQKQQTETAACGHEAYAGVIARLEAGDYDGARYLIDSMEGREAPVESAASQNSVLEIPTQPEIAQPPAVPDSTVTVDIEIIELTKYNARDYFTFEEQYYIADKSACSQYITLKEEFRDRLIAVEDVKLEVSYLLCDAYGTVDLAAGEFRSEYLDITLDEKKTLTLKIDDNGMGWISRMIYYSPKGYFPDFAKDVELESGSGKLILSVK